MAELQDWFHKYNGYSFSRHRTYNLCRRQYYYRYIARYLLKPLDDLSIPRLKRLGSLQSKYMLAGKLVHDAIERQLKIREHMDLEYAVDELKRQVDSTFNMADETLSEFHNGESVDEDFFSQTKQKGETLLETFFNEIWPPVAKRDYLEHEEFEGFALMDTRVVLKTDYVSRVGDNVVVTDWKTGKVETDADYEFQVGLYLLWAMDKYEKPYDNVRGELAYLSEGYIKPLTFKPEQLEGFAERVISGFREMNATYEIEDFQAKPSPRKCISCQFATICPDSMHKEYLKDSEENL